MGKRCESRPNLLSLPPEIREIIWYDLLTHTTIIVIYFCFARVRMRTEGHAQCSGSRNSPLTSVDMSVGTLPVYRPLLEGGNLCALTCNNFLFTALGHPAATSHALHLVLLVGNIGGSNRQYFKSVTFAISDMDLKVREPKRCPRSFTRGALLLSARTKEDELWMTGPPRLVRERSLYKPLFPEEGKTLWERFMDAEISRGDLIAEGQNLKENSYLRILNILHGIPKPLSSLGTWENHSEGTLEDDADPSMVITTTLYRLEQFYGTVTMDIQTCSPIPPPLFPERKKPLITRRGKQCTWNETASESDKAWMEEPCFELRFRLRR